MTDLERKAKELAMGEYKEHGFPLSLNEFASALTRLFLAGSKEGQREAFEAGMESAARILDPNHPDKWDKHTVDTSYTAYLSQAGKGVNL